MPIFETVLARAVNPGAGAAATPGAGDSFALRDFPSGSAYLENLWSQNATAGFVRITSPRLHDPVEALRYRTPAAVIRGLMGDEVRQVLNSADVLNVFLAGGAAETDVAALLLRYDDLKGNNGRLATWEQIAPRVRNILSHEVPVVSSATTGDWPAGAALTGTTDILQAGVDYAVLGYVVDVACAVVAIRSSETGNLRYGGPGPTEPIETRDWFLGKARALSLPAIPVFNGTNKGNTLVFVVTAAASVTVNVNLTLAELSPGAM